MKNNVNKYNQKKLKKLEQETFTYGFSGGAYFDKDKNRYVRIYSFRGKKYLKTLSNRKFRRKFKSNQDYDCGFELVNQNPKRALDFWFYD